MPDRGRDSSRCSAQATPRAVVVFACPAAVGTGLGFLTSVLCQAHDSRCRGPFTGVGKGGDEMPMARRPHGYWSESEADDHAAHQQGFVIRRHTAVISGSFGFQTQIFCEYTESAAEFVVDTGYESGFLNTGHLLLL